MYSEMLGGVYSYMLSITDDAWKYIYSLDDPHNSKLFHLAEDPDERNDLRAQRPDLLRKFEQMRFTHTSLGMVKLMHRHGSSQPADFMSDSMREQMVALGYVAAG